MVNIDVIKHKEEVMKKLLLGFILTMMILGASQAWAVPDQVSSNEYSGNTLVKSTSGTVFSVHVNYIGVTAGNSIALIDSTTSSGTVRFTCTAATTSGTCDAPLRVASYFGTAILYTESKSGGTFKTDIQYF